MVKFIWLDKEILFRGYYMAWLMAAAIILLDQISKYFARIYLQPLGSIPVVQGVFHLTYVENRGVAFGMLHNKNWIFVPVTLAIILGVALALHSMGRDNKWMKVFLGLVLGGAVGNLIDRLFLGYVVDFFDFRVWPVFNIADSCIVVGAIIVGYLVIIKGEGLSNG